MADTPESDVSPMGRSPRATAQTAADGKEPRRLLSPLRVGLSANETEELHTASTSNGAPKIMRSAPTGSPLYTKDPGEFPFNAPSNTANGTVPPSVAAESPGRVHKPSSHMSNKSTSSYYPPFAPVSRHPTGDEASEPRERKSVQFVRSNTYGTDSQAATSRQQSWDTEEMEGKGKERDKHGSSLMGKLRALTAPMQGHGRTASSTHGAASPHAPLSPTSERDEPRYDIQDSEADADGESSAGEGSARPSRRRRKSSRRWFDVEGEGTQTAPTTPKQTGSNHFFSRDRDSPNATPTAATANRPGFIRRGTMSDIPEHERQGYSEDEGRSRIAKESAWKRGLHSARGLSYGGLRQHDSNAEEEEGPERRPGHHRGFTAFGAADGRPSPWRMRGERTSSLSAQKWKSIKNSLKLLGNRAKAERQVDHAKSAELMAELLAGAPAALFLASMFQRDERGHKRIPVLLEQLKVTITETDKTKDKTLKDGDRHTALRVELEYGSGLTRMKWVVYRTVTDFANLHLKFKIQEKQDAFRNRPSGRGTDEKGDEKEDPRTKLPRFPRSVLPYLRGLRGYGALDDEEEEEEEEIAAAGHASGPDGDASATDRPAKNKRRKSSFVLARRKSSIGGSEQPAMPLSARQGSFAGAGGPNQAKLNHQDRQRKKLETYIKRLIAYLIFRPDSNRLCKFLELSALGVRLAAEGGYHGKEGFMMIKSSKGVTNNKKWHPMPIINRSWPKWFLVRHSYVVCVDSPEEMNVYDVFLVDADFNMESKSGKLRDKKARDIASEAKASATGHHQLKLVNSERKMKLLARNDKMLQQFEESITFMTKNTLWSQPQRFGSFAPVRKRIYAQWLVDGRDYMWNVSRAISMARDVIYIHDWWLSPELYLRRPAAISHKWRLDRLLQRKAQEGVKIFVIMYRNIGAAIPIDSEYSKFSLLDLHPNVFVQRSPNQIRQNTFFWSHHEKICVIDHTVAFCGGVDLCFGRWDTPQHVVVDDKLTGFEIDDNPKDADHCQLWPGKDYSNPRVQDFYALDKPYEEMYDRSKVPRMPWHDVGMQIVGQPARDLTRHFVQRWNYLLRQRKPSRPTPFLLPPPDFNPADIEALGLDGTCEVQILRSACAWSLGTPNKVEHSIMNAYVQMIATSEHFVYIENQFYISSSEVLGTKIENKINDAIVDRIKRAHANDEDWRACIVLPLMPGYQNTVDEQEGSSVRLIMTCQYHSICRGPTSIFGRLRAAGIEPEDYIEFYALRSWGEIGPNKMLVTEQLYIHAKIMVVDDRVAIIGSANINERSMLGSRDSEVAAVIRDTEVLDSYMAGQPYKVGKFPHTLRMRLMREHLGVDTDTIGEEEWMSQMSDADSVGFQTESSSPSSPAAQRATEAKLEENNYRMQDDLIAKAEKLHSFNHDFDWAQNDNPHLKANKKQSSDPRVMNNSEHAKDVRGEGADHMLDVEANRPSVSQGRDSYYDEHGHEKLVSDIAGEGLHPTPKKHSTSRTRGRSNTTGTRASGVSSQQEGFAGLPPPRLPRMDTAKLGLTQLSQLPALPHLDDTDIGGPPLQRTFSQGSSSILNPLLTEMRRPIVTDDCMRDPINDSFFLDTWHQVAENNTKIFRQVFRCMPDNEVKTWPQYKEYAAFAERFTKSQGGDKSQQHKQQDAPGKTGPPGTSGPIADRFSMTASSVGGQMSAAGEKLSEKLTNNSDKDTLGSTHHSRVGGVEQWTQDQEKRIECQSQDRLKLSTSNTTAEYNEKPGERKPADDAIVSPMVPSQPGKTFTFPAPPPEPMPTATADFATPTTRNRTVTISEPAHGNTPHRSATKRSRRRATTKSSNRAFSATDLDSMLAKEDARTLLGLVQGHLVLWPYDWLETEEKGGGWLYNVDQIAPLEIYN
ncbi:phospholipase [Parastagonospora nodorum]|nr:phospholipase [Parastagonospora nodorum]KAH4178008.1 phospholipase [Parastagonospora nodorum]KAH4607392.1 phospholipase [Parastagonospora nodorum]KAH4710985.1 phospholipase [Parastagonospora nodorum]KAH4715206.1 phospholipase [Parastagonospora nodorum]